MERTGVTDKDIDVATALLLAFGDLSPQAKADIAKEAGFDSTQEAMTAAAKKLVVTFCSCLEGLALIQPPSPSPSHHLGD